MGSSEFWFTINFHCCYLLVLGTKSYFIFIVQFLFLNRIASTGCPLDTGALSYKW